MADTRSILFETMSKLISKEISIDDANIVADKCRANTRALKTKINAVRRIARG